MLTGSIAAIANTFGPPNPRIGNVQFAIDKYSDATYAVGALLLRSNRRRPWPSKILLSRQKERRNPPVRDVFKNHLLKRYLSTTATLLGSHSLQLFGPALCVESRLEMLFRFLC